MNAYNTIQLTMFVLLCCFAFWGICKLLEKFFCKAGGSLKTERKKLIMAKEKQSKEVVDGIQMLIAAGGRFVKEWPNFIKCIDFNHTYLNAEAVRFFNEVPGEVFKALQTIAKGGHT